MSSSIVSQTSILPIFAGICADVEGWASSSTSSADTPDSWERKQHIDFMSPATLFITGKTSQLSKSRKTNSGSSVYKTNASYNEDVNIATSTTR